MVGNVVLPQVVHLVPGGGPALLPIYFLTLVAAWKYGPWVGLATAVGSPVAGCLLFGMPAEGALAVILVKGALLAAGAAWAARRTDGVLLAAIACVVIGYQVLGGVFEWALTGSFVAAAADFRVGFAGILLQIFGGRAVLRLLASKR